MSKIEEDPNNKQLRRKCRRCRSRVVVVQELPPAEFAPNALRSKSSAPRAAKGGGRDFIAR
eukprot:9937253-Prorocentrum_lima.AAC.1